MYKKYPNNPLEHFSTTKSITASKLIDLGEYNILAPNEVILYKNWYIFKDYNKDGGFLKCLSSDFSRCISGLQEGNGPLEVIGSFGIEENSNSLYIKDGNHRKFLSVDIRDSLIINVVSNNLKLLTHSRILSNNRFLALDFIKDSVVTFLSLIDTINNVHSKIDFPKDENIVELDPFQKWGIFLNTTLAISPSKEKFAWGVSCCVSSFGFGEIKNDSLIINNEFEYSLAEYNVISDQIIPKDNSLFNAISCVGTDNYVIFLYSGHEYGSLNPFGKSLLFYTWQGKPVKRVEVDYDLSYINYDKERNVLYCIAQTPEAVLVEYDMNGIIE